jgi:hypothetical protein
MKSVLFCMAGLGVGGAAWFGMTGGPDFDRIVKRPPAQVYAAFSALAGEGSVSVPARDGFPAARFKVTKVTGESISYEIDFDDRPVVNADLHFEPAGEGGRETRMTAELELDEFELGSAFQTEAGVALSMVPERLIDMQFANFMEDMVRDVEAGRPLPPLDLNRARVRRASASADPSVRRYRAEAERRAAVRPMSDARPMVDPNRAAEAYRNGESNPSGGWGR